MDKIQIPGRLSLERSYNCASPDVKTAEIVQKLKKKDEMTLQWYCWWTNSLCFLQNFIACVYNLPKHYNFFDKTQLYIWQSIFPQFVDIQRRDWLRRKLRQLHATEERITIKLCRYGESEYSSTIILKTKLFRIRRFYCFVSL